MLEQVASLDFFAKEPLPYKKMLEILERTAQETIFAPESEDAPVQVMGAYAASGQSFDAIWFLGATDTAWPATGRPNPLLPIALQRELGMPHASAAENSALAHRVDGAHRRELRRNRLLLCADVRRIRAAPFAAGEQFHSGSIHGRGPASAYYLAGNCPG